jgi:hypothetical protein
MSNKKTKVNEERQPDRKQRAPKIKASSETEVPPRHQNKEQQANKKK